MSLTLVFIDCFPPSLCHAQDEQVLTVAVLDLVESGISKQEVYFLTESLRSEIARVISSAEFQKKTGKTYKVLERKQMEKLFEEADLSEALCSDVQCAVELGHHLKAQRVIIGSIGLVGRTYSITTRIVDVITTETVGFGDYKFKGERDELLNTGIPEVASELMYGAKKKKSRMKYYIIIAGVAAAAFVTAFQMSSPENSDKSDTGSILIDIPAP